MAAKRKEKEEEEDEEVEEEEAGDEEETDEEGEEEEEPIAKSKPAKQAKKAGTVVKIADPLFFWVMVLVLSMILQILLVDSKLFLINSPFYNFANEISTFFLFSTGSLILPLIIGAVIGAEVGTKASSFANAVKGGLLNGVYAAIVYIISIIVIYEILIFVIPHLQFTVSFLAYSMIIPQVAVLIVVVEVFAALSHARKVGV